MHDQVELRKRIERLLAKVERRDAYGQLLAQGHVVVGLSDVDDPDAWRADLRRQARGDKIRIRTGVNSRIAWALLVNAGTNAREDEGRRYRAAMRMAIPRAASHHHQPAVWIRDGDETVCGCERCQAFGLVDYGADSLIAGQLFEVDCPHDDPPAETAATMFFGGASESTG
jgi:hypothetical protein